ncbi:MAG: hypothetical protein JWR20_1146 [Marmoricola sp.]|nr:hypothetical protein [Marmoricola sp.]
MVRRGPDRLQVGLHPDRRSILPRTATVERLLLDLLHGTVPSADAATADVVAQLRRAGCLEPWPPADPPRVAVLEHPSGAGGHDVGAGLGALLEAAGLRVTPWLSRCDVALVESWSEVDRDVLDPLLRAGTPHLVVRLVDGGAVLGPFVEPGTTACVRCTDAHRSTEDPDHVPVTTRYVHATGALHRPEAVPHVAALAQAWAVRDLLAHLAGRRPATWSTTWHLPADGGAPVVQEWHRHPACGCCWAADARPSGTMEP